MLTGHPVFWVLLVAVTAPLLAEIPVGFRVPVVVLEVVLGIVIGPHVLGLTRFDGFLAAMFTYGMGASLFVAGMELDWERIRGRPLALAACGWVVSLALGFAAVGVLHVVPLVHAPLMVALALATTSLGVLLPVFRDSGHLGTRFGSLFLAVGTLGEVGPIVAMSLLLSTEYSAWHEAGFLLVVPRHRLRCRIRRPRRTPAEGTGLSLPFDARELAVPGAPGIAHARSDCSCSPRSSGSRGSSVPSPPA